MAKLQGSDITGLVTATLDAHRKGAITDLTSDLQKYTALSSIMRKQRMAWEGGEQFTFVIQHDAGGSARASGLYDDDQIVVSDALATGRIPIRHFTWNCAWDRLESAFNKGAAQIVDHIELRKRAEKIGAFKFFEDQLWSAPASSTDTDRMWGIDLAITYPTSFSAAGFCGGNPSGFTGGYAGINHTTYPRWGNYYNQYAAMNYDDLAMSWIRATLTCDFQPAVPYKGARTRGGYAYYAGMDVMLEMYRLIRSQNDNWGVEVAAGSNGTPLFRRVPINHVPQLDSALAEDTDTRSSMASYDPIYGINWSTWKMIFFGENWMHQTVKQSATKRNVTEAHWDLSINPACLDRRPNFLLSKAI